ncbi:hypothetical protein [Actinoallomurus sp. NPDC050550]|uniref:hypothetical protein n=1 Tax=Actinoallomurus sp. NPDC050550 TaxID=3154937 RepID=UPI00340C34F5
MGDAFYVSHNKYAEVNVALKAQLQKMDTIMGDLNGTLSRIEIASGGKATPLWEHLQQTWNRSYEEMTQMLRMHVDSSLIVAETFLHGDDAGARVMT